jgi:hypothetical protein
MHTVADVAGTGDAESLETIFGPDATDVLWSGDPVTDRQDGQRVKEMIKERLEFTETGEGTTVAVIGNDRWDFPIPLVRDPDGWRFDLEAGREELHNRRVGRNELSTMDTLREIVEAQREYRSTSRDGNPPRYARKVRSTEGLHDGLYWEGEPASPLGPLLAEAADEGYGGATAGEERAFHGYRYKLLVEQGPSAPGGRRSYVDAGGNLTGGFAVLAWPAIYGNSGIMTFMVNHVGIVFQKDLGPQTDDVASAINAYDPDETWAPAEPE